MNNPLGVSPSKGKQGTTRGKEKIFWPRWESNPSTDLRIRSTIWMLCRVTLPTELRDRTEKDGDDFRWWIAICVPSATRHNIHMHPYVLFAAIHHLKSSPTFSLRSRSSVCRVTVDLIRRSWVRFPPRSKYFFFASCGSLFPFTRANAQWVIHGFK